MKKNFFKLSLTLNIIFAVLSAIFMFIYASLDKQYDGEAFFTFLGYVKTFFDLLAVFIGYATIIYAFAKFDFKNGLISIGTFSVSVFISFITMIVGSCISYSGEFTLDFFFSIAFYSAGSCFITQLIPALIIALITYKVTSKATKVELTSFIAWKNPLQRAMLIITLCLFGFNIIYLTAFNVFPFLIENSFEFYADEIGGVILDITLSYISKIVFYLVMQYLVYYFMYKIYDAYLASHREKEMV